MLAACEDQILRADAVAFLEVHAFGHGVDFEEAGGEFRDEGDGDDVIDFDVGGPVGAEGGDGWVGYGMIAMKYDNFATCGVGLLEEKMRPPGAG